jgi:GTP-binding protein Era
MEVAVEEFKEEKDIIRIRAVILMERDTQKGIIIGHKGEAIKKLGTLARKDIELFFEKKIYLQLYVKVEKDWRDRDNLLKQFGYKLD